MSGTSDRFAARYRVLVAKDLLRQRKGKLGDQPDAAHAARLIERGALRLAMIIEGITAGPHGRICGMGEVP